MKKFPTLYKQTKTLATQVWQIFVDGDSFYTRSGQLGGAIVESARTVCKGKNIGKSNETSPESQAEAEALASWVKKTEKGYTTSINEIGHGCSFFEPMLARKYLDRKDKIKFPVLASRKLDGLRMIATKYGLATRNGKPFNSCPHILEVLKPLFNKHPNWVIDGEIYSEVVPFEEIVSLTRKKDPSPEDLKQSAKICQLYIFDGVIDDSLAGFVDRFNIIKNEIKSLIGNTKSIKIVENTEVNSHEEIEELHDKFVSEGFEGLMVRIPDSKYENKRSNFLMKFKRFLDSEEEIIDIVEGIGNRSGMAGNILCKMKNGKTFGAGIRGDEEYFIQLLKNKKSYIGKMATIRYQQLTGDGVPRFPVCVCIDPIDR